MNQSNEPRCPRCRSSRMRKLGEKHYFCVECRAESDGIDDGDVGYGRPSKRLERQERHMEARR